MLSRPPIPLLQVACIPFDSDLSILVDQVLLSVQWPSLVSLVLYGSNIDQWIQLWPSAVSMRLRSLILHGLTAQELSRSSALFLQELMFMGLAEELRFSNVQMQNKRDWMPIIESLDSVLTIFDLCESSSIQFNSSGEAYDLYNAMFTTTIEGRGETWRTQTWKLQKTGENTDVDDPRGEDSDYEDW